MRHWLPVILAVVLAALWVFHFAPHLDRANKPPSLQPPVRVGPRLASPPGNSRTGLPDGAIRRLGTSHFQHEDIIFLHRIQYSPDGQWLVCTDGSDYFVWSLASGQRVRRFKGGTMHSPFDVTPDSRFLACTADEVETPAGVDPGPVAGKQSVCVFDLSTWEKRVCEDSSGWFRDLRFSPDGQRLLGSQGRTVSVWEASTGRLVDRITEAGFGEGIFTPDTRFLIWSTGARVGKPVPIHVWSFDRRQEVALLPGHEGGFVMAQAVSPDGRRLATAGSAGGIRLWDLEKQAMLHELEPTEQEGNFPGTAVAFSPDGQQLVTAKVHHPWRLWDCATGKELASWPSDCFPHTAAFSPDGSTIAYIGDGKRVCFRDVLVGQDQPTRIGHTGEITDCLVTADGSAVVSAGEDGRIIAWSLSSGRPLGVLRPGGRSVYALCHGLEEGSIFAAGAGFLHCLDLAAGKVLRSFATAGRSCFDLDVSSGTGRIVADVADPAKLPRGRTAWIFDGRSGEKLGAFSSNETLVGAEYGRFLPGTDRLLIGVGPAPVIVDYRTGTVERTHEFGGERFLSALRCSPDGRYVAVADCLGKLVVWDRETDRETLQLQTMGPESHGMAFTTDGALLALGLRDTARLPAVIRLFRPESGIQVATFSPDVGRVKCLAFSPNGELLVSGSGEASLLV